MTTSSRDNEAYLKCKVEDLTKELSQANRTLMEAFDQQAGTSEIMRVMSSSPTDLQRVFAEVAESAARLCDAFDAVIFQVDADVLRLVGHHGPIQVGPLGQFTVRIVRGFLVGRTVLGRQTIQVADLQAEIDEYPGGSEHALRFGYHTQVSVPLIRSGEAIGVISVRRTEVRLFTDRQVELLKTFADQAVIAIENARLFEEAQSRTRELIEALEYRTATSDVLNVISRSPTRLEPVLEAILETAARLCEAEYALFFKLQDGKYHVAASNNTGAAHVKYASEHPMAPGRGSLVGRTALERRTIHLPDCQADPEYTNLKYQSIGQYRTVLGVPLLRKGLPIGVLVLHRDIVKPFTKLQIDLVETFADQALIAIENVRLFEEIEDKSRQLQIANTYKSRFLAAASHDLRQPLHALNLFVAQLRAESTAAEQGRLIARIDAAVSSMNELFDALLDMSKLDAGVLEPNLTDFPVQRVLKRMETTFAQAAREKGLRLGVVSSDLWVRSDFILLERILLNLVSNAVRYTQRGGVVVGCRRRGNLLRIDVRDSGVGIPHDQQRHIFSEFYQLGNQVDRRGGLGLGLSIVDRLSQLLEHPVELNSRPGKGSRFSISVPLVAARHATAEAAELPATITDPARGKLIVVVDDDLLVLDGMRGILQSWGCRVEIGESDTVVLAQLVEKGERPDLIICDYRLADGGSGIQAIERLRRALGFAVPAFLISGDTGPERLREARASGCHLLHKPVPPMALRTALNRLLKGHDGQSARP